MHQPAANPMQFIFYFLDPKTFLEKIILSKNVTIFSYLILPR